MNEKTNAIDPGDGAAQTTTIENLPDLDRIMTRRSTNTLDLINGPGHNSVEENGNNNRLVDLLDAPRRIAMNENNANPSSFAKNSNHIALKPPIATSRIAMKETKTDLVHVVTNENADALHACETACQIADQIAGQIADQIAFQIAGHARPQARSLDCIVTRKNNNTLDPINAPGQNTMKENRIDPVRLAVKDMSRII